MRSIRVRLDPLALQDMKGVIRQCAARKTELTSDRQAFLQSTATVSSSHCLDGPLTTNIPNSHFSRCPARICNENDSWEETNALLTWKNTVDKAGLVKKELVDD
jgi:hypothetical protein